LAERIYGLGIANEAQLLAIDEEAKHDVAESVKFADESPWPDPATLYDDVYTEPKQEEKVVSLPRRAQA
jgi:TPP-dependent pyruvate/acetoin dehydrogenase alpha subunit